MSELLNVLILEDRQADAELMLHELRCAGFTPQYTCVDNKADYQAQLSTEPDIILSDYELPQFQAPQALTLLQERELDIPFIIVTGAISEEVAVACMKQGATDYLLKDRLARLGEAVRQALQQKALRDEKRQVQRALRESEERFRAIFEFAPVGILVGDANGRFVQANQASQAILGYSATQLQQRTFRDITCPDDLEESTRLHQALTESRIDHFRQEKRYQCRKGKVIWSDTTVFSIQGSDEARYTIALLQDITEKKRIEAEQERLFSELQTAHERLKELSRRLVEVQEAERRHIARELHDEVGQALTAVNIHLQKMDQLCDKESLKPELEESIHIIKHTLQQVRNLSLDLRPSLLDDFGLVPTLRWYLDRQTRLASFATRFETNLETRLPAELEVTCFRVVQEALTNVMRHAQAGKVSIELNQYPTIIELIIQDDGVGFDPQSALKEAIGGASLGLLSMEERVILAGGQITITSQPGHGTNIQVLFPIK